MWKGREVFISVPLCYINFYTEDERQVVLSSYIRVNETPRRKEWNFYHNYIG